MGEILVLRLVHVLGGVFWVGAALLNFIYIAPALAAAGPAAAGPVMATLRQRKLFVVLPTVALLTILSGLRLIMITSNGFDARYFQSPVGATFAGAGGLAILAFVLGLALAMPAQKRMAVLGPQIAAATDDASRSAAQAEMGRLQQRLRVIGPVVTGLLLLAAAGMAVARYVS